MKKKKKTHKVKISFSHKINWIPINPSIHFWPRKNLLKQHIRIFEPSLKQNTIPNYNKVQFPKNSNPKKGFKLTQIPKRKIQIKIYPTLKYKTYIICSFTICTSCM
jgi:hypothetical protein